MNDLQIFNNPKFGQVRTITENGKVLFCGSDVAKALGYKRPNDAINAHCRATVKRSITDALGRSQDANFIQDGDIYRLAAKSELPGAAEFESWIFDEVLPSIHKHGAYMTPETLEAALLNPDTIIKIATALKEEQDKRKALECKVEADKPKVLFADAVSASYGTILIGELAKLLKQNGVDVGQNRLFEWLRNNGYLIKRKGVDYNMPTQRSMDLKLFAVKERTVTEPNGSIRTTKTTLVTGKGQQYFINLFLLRS